MSKAYTSSTVVDIGPEAFTLATDAMVMLLFPALYHSGVRMLRKTTGVRVSATEPHFTTVKIPTTHAILRKGGTVSKVTQLMESTMPLLTYKQPSQAAAAPGFPILPTTFHAPINPAAWLHTVVDPASPDFGCIPSDAITDPTTTLVAHPKLPLTQGRLPMPVSTVQATLNLIQTSVVPVLKDFLLTPAERCRVVIEICPELYKAHYSEMVPQPSETGEGDALAGDPSASGGAVADSTPSADEATANVTQE